MTELVKCNKAVRKCRTKTKNHGPCPHAVFHERKRDYNAKGELSYCTEGDICNTPYGNVDEKPSIRVRCMTKEELKNWHTEAKKFRAEINKLSKKYKITLEELL